MQSAKTNPDNLGPNVDGMAKAVETITEASKAVCQQVGDGGQVTVERFEVPQEAIKDAVNNLRMARGEPKKVCPAQLA